MTYAKEIEQALLSGETISYRLAETKYMINHPRKAIYSAIETLKSKGVAVRSGQNINANTGKIFKTWRLE